MWSLLYFKLYAIPPLQKQAQGVPLQQLFFPGLLLSAQNSKARIKCKEMIQWFIYSNILCSVLVSLCTTSTTNGFCVPNPIRPPSLFSRWQFSPTQIPLYKWLCNWWLLIAHLCKGLHWYHYSYVRWYQLNNNKAKAAMLDPDFPHVQLHSFDWVVSWI